MSDTYRLFGPAVGFDAAVVDARVAGLETNGTVELTVLSTSQSGNTDNGELTSQSNSGNQETFTIDFQRLQELAADGLAYDHQNITPDAPVWEAIGMADRKFDAQDFANERVVLDAARMLFKGAA